MIGLDLIFNEKIGHLRKSMFIYSYQRYPCIVDDCFLPCCHLHTLSKWLVTEEDGKTLLTAIELSRSLLQTAYKGIFVS